MGWARTAGSHATVFSPARSDEIDALLQTRSARGFLARGLGRSYGDAAQNSGGGVIKSRSLGRVLETDVVRGHVTVEAGVTIEDLIGVFVPCGWFPPVVPGTRFVTVGGAIAADIHGKNHHSLGSFASHILSMTVVTGSGRRELTPQDPLFWATVGGMGLTGVIVKATLALQPVRSGCVLVDTQRLADLDETLRAVEEQDDHFPYSVAWIDTMATGKSLGRSVLTNGSHAAEPHAPGLRDEVSIRPPAKFPLRIPPGRLGHVAMKCFNEMFFRLAPRNETGKPTSVDRYFFPLDKIDGWNRFYGRKGFIQYQFVVPLNQEGVLERALLKLHAAGCPSFLSVLKRFGPGNEGLLSFPMEGWTVALDIPITVPDLGALLNELDELVATSGGRVYLAKDSRLRADMFRAMYPRLAGWKELRAEADPQSIFQSDLARRLDLV